jgi:hypothetical protein
MNTDTSRSDADDATCAITVSSWFPGIWGFALLIAVAAASPSAAAPLLEEASGLARIGDFMAIVSDKDPGAYYEIPLPVTDAGVVKIDPSRVRKVTWPAAAVALDLEGIAILTDGRVVLLSERLRALIGEQDVVAEYDNPLSEFGNRGLEGVAVRPLAGGASRVAVLWEGGYPEFHAVPPQLQNLNGRRPLRPQIWCHTLAAGTSRVRVELDSAGSLDLERIELKPPLPEGTEPDAQRFRATDLVWHHFSQAASDSWGFIVLLNSGNSPSTGTPVYTHQWLQKFSRSGDPVGPPIDLNQLVPESLRHANWEGLAWLEEGSRLVLVHDRPPAGTPSLLIVTLPHGW